MMQYRISGEIAQAVRLEMEQGETIWASKGALMSYSSGVEWTLRVPGGLGGAVRRSLAGEGISLAYLEAGAPSQHVVVQNPVVRELAPLLRQLPVAGGVGDSIVPQQNIDLTPYAGQTIRLRFRQFVRRHSIEFPFHLRVLVYKTIERLA